ncbi:DNA binding domain-containing protein, excisionase family [Rhodopirellula maiorica SM1]|uniref:DNA binding domain-containing protein, excisionase family n=1 Tax=Rhodopirellula maiorica SM1 TaxID=1265738 RepID=M5RHP9_9BACT|nr:DNA binding domain-containing protein, excisionase family [Rhodopirellula maiorica SM1]
MIPPLGNDPVAARQPHYSPKQIADALQVSESSVKRWCDRGTINTIRTVGGHRRIALDGLQAFLSQADRALVNPDVLGLPALSSCRKSEISGADTADQRQFRNAIAVGDEPTCRQILHARIASRRKDQGQTCAEIAEWLIADAMHGLGDAWCSNELDVYQERRACGIAHRLISELTATLPPPKSTALTAVGGAPEGDHYQLPMMLVQLALRERGWNSVCLGNHLPLQSFAQAAHDYHSDMVWLSVSAMADATAFIAEETKLAADLGEHIPLLVGGRALCDEIRPRLRYTAHCDNLRQFVELVAMMQLSLRR